MDDIPISSSSIGSEPQSFAELQQRQLDGYSDPSRLNPNALKRNSSNALRFHQPDEPMKAAAPVDNRHQYEDPEQAEFEALEAQLLQEQGSGMDLAGTNNVAIKKQGLADDISPSRVRSKLSTQRKRSQSGIRQKESGINNTGSSNSQSSSTSMPQSSMELLGSHMLSKLSYEDAMNSTFLDDEEASQQPKVSEQQTHQNYFPNAAVPTYEEEEYVPEYIPYDDEHHNITSYEDNDAFEDEHDVQYQFNDTPSTNTGTKTNYTTTVLNSSASVHDEHTDDDDEEADEPQQGGWREVMYGKPSITSALQQPKKAQQQQQQSGQGQVVVDFHAQNKLSNKKDTLKRTTTATSSTTSSNNNNNNSVPAVKKTDTKLLDTMPPHLLESVEVLEQLKQCKLPAIVHQRCERLEQLVQICMSEHQQQKKTIATVSHQGKQQKEAFLKQKEKLEAENKARTEEHKVQARKIKAERDGIHKLNAEQGVSRKERDELVALRKEVERQQALGKQQSSKFLNERTTLRGVLGGLQDDVARLKEELHLSELARIDAEAQVKKIASERKAQAEERKQLLAAASTQNSSAKEQEVKKVANDKPVEPVRSVSSAQSVLASVKKQQQQQPQQQQQQQQYVQAPALATPAKPKPEAEEVLNIPSISILLPGAAEIETIQHPCGKQEQRYSNGARVVYFGNGSRKIMWTNGQSRADFPNGDWKQTNVDHTVVYFYKASQTTHTTHPDGIHVYQFGDNQTETHFVDGRKEILFRDGTLKYVEPNGDATSVFPNGQHLFQKAGEDPVLFQA